MFNRIFTGGATGVNVGMVGGINQFPSSYDSLCNRVTVGADLSSLAIRQWASELWSEPIARLARA